MAFTLALLVAAATAVALLPAGEWRWHARTTPQPPPWLPLPVLQCRLLLFASPLLTAAIFYPITGSWIAALSGSLAGPLALRTLIDQLVANRIRQAREQFHDAMLAVAASLRAGHSLPSALLQALNDLRRIYPPTDPVPAALAAVVAEMQLNRPVDAALEQLRHRLPLEEVASLVDTTRIVRQKGGNLVEVLCRVAELIAEKLATEREISALTAEKRLEATLVSVMPLIMFGLQRVAAPQYLAPLFETTLGQAVLGAAFCLTAAAYWVALRIANIAV